MSKKNKAIIMMIICSAMWSIAGIVIKQISCNPMVIAGFRSLIAAITVAVFMKATGQKWRFSPSVLLSAAFLCATFFAFVGANKLTTAANAIVLQFTSPVFILIVSGLFFKQRVLKCDVYAVALTLFGIALFFFDGLDAGNTLGNAVGVLSGFFMGMMFVTCGGCPDEERMSGILLGHIFTAAIGISFFPFTQNALTAQSVFWLLVLGIVQLGIPYILVGLSLGACPPLACCLISVIEPLLNPVWVFIFDGERPGVLALIGAVIIIVTITYWCIYKEKHYA